MTITLKDLDQAFADLWIHTDMLPTLLEKWQELVAEYMASVEPSQQILIELEQRINHWEMVLEENRTLLEMHQLALKKDIKTGEKDAKKEAAATKYKS